MLAKYSLSMVTNQIRTVAAIGEYSVYVWPRDINLFWIEQRPKKRNKKKQKKTKHDDLNWIEHNAALDV